jgi:integrase/recombinase XerD
VDRLAVRDLTSGLVLRFLAHLEEDRDCSTRTRNQRLAAIRAFARFVGSRDPAHVEWCGHIRAIASKKSMPTPVGWLTRAEMEAMLAVPDRRTKRGRSEYALLLFLYNTGVSAPLSGTGRDRLKAAAMRHQDVIRCGLCGVKLAIIEQNEA